jgi:beta-glucuronidase
VNGSIWWALRDFRVHPQWSGGAPEGYTVPPWHNKSLIEETNARKGVYFDMKKRWRRTKPLLPVGRRPARRARGPKQPARPAAQGAVSPR